jgi:hypothetical protein
MNYDSALKIAKRIENTHGQELKNIYGIISKKVSIKDFKRFTKTKKDLDFIESLDDETIKKITKVLASITVIIGMVRVVGFTGDYLHNGVPTSSSLDHIMKLIIVSLWVSLAMSYFEKEKYINEVDNPDTDTYKIFHDAMDNRRRFWKKLKSLKLIDLSIDVIVSFITMSLRMFKWQLQLAKENSKYSVLFMTNILVNVLILYYAAKTLLRTYG